MKHHLLTAFATLAGLFAAWSIARTQPQRSLRDPVVEPARPKFTHTVAAVGMVEPSSETIAVGSSHSGLVTSVLVKAGQDVHLGDPLFQLDDRHLRAAVALQKSQLTTAEARIETARAQLEDLSDQFARAETLANQTVVTTEEVTRKRFAVRLAKAGWSRPRPSATAPPPASGRPRRRSSGASSDPRSTGPCCRCGSNPASPSHPEPPCSR